MYTGEEDKIMNIMITTLPLSAVLQMPPETYLFTYHDQMSMVIRRPI